MLFNLLFMASVLQILLGYFVRVVQSVPCPVETPLYGGAILDGSSDEYEIYFAVQDDDLTQIVGMEWCLKDGLFGLVPAEHFRGFRPEIFSPTSGTSFQTFGTMDQPDDNCFQVSITEEIMFLTVYSDINDSEGFVFEGYTGTQYEFRANGNDASPIERLGGRPIGFRVWMGTGGQLNQPLLIAIVYNGCNCPASTFTGLASPVDMQTQAVVGAPSAQSLPYQDNYMEFVYGQDCGGYYIRFFPDLPFLVKQTTGLNLSPQGNPYEDQLSLQGTTVDDIGIYTVEMEIGQDVTNPTHGFSQPYRGVITPIRYPFTVTITPCVINSFTNIQQVQDISYNLGDAPKDSTLYAHLEDPICGYPPVITILGAPSFVTHEEASSFLRVQTTNTLADVGEYTITVRAQINVPDTAEKLTFTTFTQEHTFKLFVNPCQVSLVNVAQSTLDMNYAIGATSATTSNAYQFSQSPSCAYPFDIVVTNLPTFIATHNTASRSFSVGPSNDLTRIGSYTVTVQASVTFFVDSSLTTQQTQTNSFSFVIFVDPCEVTDYRLGLTPNPVVYFLGFPQFDGAAYSLIEDPACGYVQNIQILNLPPFMVHNGAQQDFTIPQFFDQSAVNTYFVTIQADLSVPTDFTQTTFDTLTVSYALQVTIENCIINSFTDASAVGNMVYFLRDAGFTSTGQYAFVQDPSQCNYAESITISGLPTPPVTHNTASKDFTLAPTSDTALIGEYLVTVTGEITAPTSTSVTTSVPIQATHQFLVQINPCQINSVSQTLFASDLTYSPGDPSTSTQYDFAQDKDCGYSLDISLIDLPFFMNHNLASRTLNLPLTNDLSIVGIYQVTIRAEVTFFDDYTQSTSTTRFIEQTITVTVLACQVTSFDSVLSPGDISQQIGEVGVSNQAAYQFAENPGNCGYPVTITITGLPPFAQHNVFAQDFSTSQVDDTGLIGAYEVVILAELEILIDSQSSTYQILSQTERFFIFIQPCQLTDYVAQIQAADIFYTLGTPGGATGNSYLFTQVGQCTYPDQITVTNLPNFATHDTLASNFAVQTLGLNEDSKLGKYDVTIKGEVSFPSDYTQTTLTKLEVEYTFSIFIEPCTVNLYQTQAEIPDFTYILGSASRTEGPYFFQQNPACFYTQTSTFTNLPTIVAHQSASRDLLIQASTDSLLAGNYIVTHRSEIEFWTDFTKSTRQTLFEQYQFTIRIVDPCETSILNDFIVNDMTRAVIQPELQQTVSLPSDVASTTFGNQDGFSLCGPRSLTISTLPTSFYSSFLQFDPTTNTLTVQTDDPLDVGEYTLQMTVSLDAYPSITKTQSFKVFIVECTVSDLILPATPQPKITYNIYYALKSFTVASFTQSPQCGYPIDYQVQIKDPFTGTYSPVDPAWLTSPTLLAFEVETSDPSLVGLYQLSIIGTVSDTFQAVAYSEELLIEIELNNVCVDDQVQVVGTLSNQLYYIDETGQLILNPQWIHSFTECPVTFEISRIDGNTERPLNLAEQSVLNHSSTDGSLNIATSDFSLDQQVWLLKVFMRSSESTSVNRDGIFLLELTYKDACWDSNLQSAQFLQPLYNFDLYQLQQLQYAEMRDLDRGLSCGGYTHEITYVSGPAFDPLLAPVFADLTHYSQSAAIAGTITVQGSISDKLLWLGEHKLRIKSTNGQFDASLGARGNQGLYESVFSTEVVLRIVDPCLNSVVNFDNILKVVDMRVPLGLTVLTNSYTGPKDSVSATYGNGYDKCGALQYTILDEEGNEFISSFFGANTVQNANFADSFDLTLNSDATGNVNKASFKLKIGLEDYPEAISAFFDVNLYYRECFPTEFMANDLENQVLVAGDEGEIRLDYTFSQYPCSFDQTYSVVQLDKVSREEKKLPRFVTLENLEFIIRGTQFEDVGTYEILITSQLDNSVRTKSTRLFTITIKEPKGPVVIVSKTPEFLLNLQDQRVAVGQSLIYAPDARVGTYGYLMDLQVDIGGTYPFAVFETEQNIFKVDGDKTTLEDVGIYEVFIIATFFNATFSEQFVDSFLLTVYSEDPLPPPLPADTIFYPQWEQGLRESFQPEPFDIEKPIPYIVSLTAAGVLTIGWDRKMLKPDDIYEIPPAKVAVLNWTDLDKYRKLRPPQVGGVSTTNQGRIRNLQEMEVQLDTNDPSLVWFAEEGDLYAERRKLVDALEVRITPENPEQGRKIEFTWDILGYSEEFIWLQLVIANPWDITEETQQDMLSVTFWGTEYFRSVQGKEVRFGTTLYQPILRQIKLDDAGAVDNLSYLNSWFLASILLIGPFASLGSLLPTWMFINSLQLIAHTPLLNCDMPGNAQYFLNKYLDLVRWRNSDINDWLQSIFRWKNYETSVGFYHYLLEINGYNHLYGQNLALILFALFLIGAVWIALAVKDHLVRRGRIRKRKSWLFKKPHEPRCQNFILRFAYEFFLEFCICVFINISIADFSQFSPSFHFLSSILALLAIFGSVGYIIYLFYNRGPYVDGYYRKNTFSSSIWAPRPTNDAFDAKSYIKENRRKKSKIPSSWFRFRIGNHNEYSDSDFSEQQQIQNAKIKGNDSLQGNTPNGRQTPDQLNKMLTDDNSSANNSHFMKSPHLRETLDIVNAREESHNQSGSNQQNSKVAGSAENSSSILSNPKSQLKSKSKSNQSVIQQEESNKSAEGPIDFFNEHNSYQFRGLDRGLDPQDARQSLPPPTLEKPSLLQSEAINNLNDIEQGGNQGAGQNASVNIHNSQCLTVDLASQVNLTMTNNNYGQSRGDERQFFEGGQFEKNVVLPAESVHSEQIKQKSTFYSAGSTPQTKAEVPSDQKSDSLSLKRQDQREIKRAARTKIRLDSTIKKPKRYRTIFYGLKVNHPRNVALVHPLMFLVRRIIYALIIVSMNTVHYWNILLFMACTLTMLGYVLAEHQWQDRIINNQHIVNEMALYTLTVTLLLFSDFVSAEMRYLVGFFVIGLVFAFVVYNTIIMLLYSARIAILVLKREYVRMRSKTLKQEVDIVVENIEKDINSWPEEERAWFVPDNLEDPIQLEYVRDNKFTVSWQTERTYYGGIRGGILTTNAIKPAKGLFDVVYEESEGKEDDFPWTERKLLQTTEAKENKLAPQDLALHEYSPKQSSLNEKRAPKLIKLITMENQDTGRPFVEETEEQFKKETQGDSSSHMSKDFFEPNNLDHKEQILRDFEIRMETEESSPLGGLPKHLQTDNEFFVKSSKIDQSRTNQDMKIAANTPEQLAEAKNTDALDRIAEDYEPQDAVIKIENLDPSSTFVNPNSHSSVNIKLPKECKEDLVPKRTKDDSIIDNLDLDSLQEQENKLEAAILSPILPEPLTVVDEEAQMDTVGLRSQLSKMLNQKSFFEAMQNQKVSQNSPTRNANSTRHVVAHSVQEKNGDIYLGTNAFPEPQPFVSQLAVPSVPARMKTINSGLTFGGQAQTPNHMQTKEQDIPTIVEVADVRNDFSDNTHHDLDMMRNRAMRNRTIVLSAGDSSQEHISEIGGNSIIGKMSLQKIPHRNQTDQPHPQQMKSYSVSASKATTDLFNAFSPGRLPMQQTQTDLYRREISNQQRKVQQQDYQSHPSESNNFSHSVETNSRLQGISPRITAHQLGDKSRISFKKVDKRHWSEFKSQSLVYDRQHNNNEDKIKVSDELARGPSAPQPQLQPQPQDLRSHLLSIDSQKDGERVVRQDVGSRVSAAMRSNSMSGLDNEHSTNMNVFSTFDSATKGLQVNRGIDGSSMISLSSIKHKVERSQQRPQDSQQQRGRIQQHSQRMNQPMQSSRSVSKGGAKNHHVQSSLNQDTINSNKVFNINLLGPKGHTVGEDFPFQVDVAQMRKNATCTASQGNFKELSRFPSSKDLDQHVFTHQYASPIKKHKTPGTTSFNGQSLLTSQQLNTIPMTEPVSQIQVHSSNLIVERSETRNQPNHGNNLRHGNTGRAAAVRFPHAKTLIEDRRQFSVSSKYAATGLENSQTGRQLANRQMIPDPTHESDFDLHLMVQQEKQHLQQRDKHNLRDFNVSDHGSVISALPKQLERATASLVVDNQSQQQMQQMNLSKSTKQINQPDGLFVHSLLSPINKDQSPSAGIVMPQGRNASNQHMHRMSTASINGAQISGLTPSHALLTSTRSQDGEGQMSAPNLLSRRILSGDRLLVDSTNHQRPNRYQQPNMIPLAPTTNDSQQFGGIYIQNEQGAAISNNSRSPIKRHQSSVIHNPPPTTLKRLSEVQEQFKQQGRRMTQPQQMQRNQAKASSNLRDVLTSQLQGANGTGRAKDKKSHR